MGMSTHMKGKNRRNMLKKLRKEKWKQTRKRKMRTSDISNKKIFITRKHRRNMQTKGKNVSRMDQVTSVKIRRQKVKEEWRERMTRFEVTSAKWKWRKRMKK